MGTGIPWFPFDVHLDDKFELIEAEFGLKGFAVIVKLLQRIYGGQGYYCEWTNDVALLFSKSIGEGSNVVSEILSAAIRRGIFDKSIYDKYGVLTSKGIQKRYFEAVSRRVNVEVKKEYLLVKLAQKSKNVNILSGNVNIFNENAYRNGQSKEEYSREEYSKDICSEQGSDPPAMLLPLNDKSEYPVSKKYVDEMSELYQNVDVIAELKKMRAWLINNPSRKKTKKGIQRFINSWLMREQDRCVAQNRGQASHSGTPLYSEEDGADNDWNNFTVER